MPKIGDRVFAVRNSDKENVYLFGYGTYEGDKFPEYRFTKEELEKQPLLKNYKNPCIKLDNGDIVWGYECWWGAESQIEKLTGRGPNKNIIIVPVPVRT